MTRLLIPVLLFFALVGNNATIAQDELETIVPSDGYEWPQDVRLSSPTDAWLTSAPDEHDFDTRKLADALQRARDDEFFRALLVVRGGELVVEEYFNGGASDQSTEVWSVTKSFISALIGIAIKQGYIESLDDRMVDYLPDYPEFANLTIRHILSHTTGLEWTEEGDDFVGWIASDDWIRNAAGRNRLHEPGTTLLYSSGNSHFLSALIAAATGTPTGTYADKHLFSPLGISFERRPADNRVAAWEDFLVRTPHTWKLDARGIEVGAFGLSLTARDMTKFGLLYLNKGRWGDAQLVPEEWIEESTRDHVLRNSNFGFGYHWVVARRGGHLAFNADGWGGQIICVVPSLDMVVVIKSDAERPGSHAYYDILASVIEAASPT
jgi:CubicO group peptidase (beta-lactamase class C family)